MGRGMEFVGRRAKRLPPPGEGGIPVDGILNDLVFFIGERDRPCCCWSKDEGILNDLVFFIGERWRRSMDDDEGYRFEGEIGVGGAVGRDESGLAENEIDIGDAIPSASGWDFAWTTISSEASESEDRDDNSEDKDETEGERMRVD